MKVLNGYQWRVLKRAAEYEKATDYRLHAAMKHETAELLDLYDNKFSEMPNDEKEILVDTLLTIYDFWALYFISPREAEHIWNFQQEQMMNDLHIQVELNRKRMVEELEEMLYGKAPEPEGEVNE